MGHGCPGAGAGWAVLHDSGSHLLRIRDQSQRGLESTLGSQWRQYEETFPVWVFSDLRRSYNLPIVNAIATLVSAVQVIGVYALYLLIKWLGKRRGSGDDLTSLVAGGRG